jgi:hypothetical protein
MLRSERNRFDLLDDIFSRAQLLGPVRTPGTQRAKRRPEFPELSWPCRYAGTLECPPISTHGCTGRLAATVLCAQPISIVNAKTAEAMACEVAFAKSYG